MSRLIPRAFQLHLPRTVLVLQSGSAVSSLGFGLILPFEIIYLHQVRGFSVPTAGLVLATVMATATVLSPPAGALIDRFRAKPLVLAGSLAGAAGNGGLAFVTDPWVAALCAAVSGAGFAATSAAGPTLVMTLVDREQRPTAVALQRVAINLGIGIGASIGGIIVQANEQLANYQALFLLDALMLCVYASVVMIAVPNVAVAARDTDSPRAGFRAVAADHTFLTLMAGNVVLTIVGYALLANILPPFVAAHTGVGPRGIGLLFLVNTALIVVAQLPAARIVTRLRRTQVFAGIGAAWAIACLGVLLAAAAGSPVWAEVVLVAVAAVFGIGECAHFVVLAPTVVDLAPPALLGRYMSVYGLTFSAGLALGPAVGSALLALSPDSVWWAGAAAVATVGVVLYRLGDRVPDRLTGAGPATPTAVAPEVPA